MAKSKKALIIGLGLIAVGAIAYFVFKEEEGYPKTISRGPYSFLVYNEEEEIQMKEFLGIDPPGLDIDTYLSALTPADLDYWKNYWNDIWTGLGRNDMVLFVNQMYDKYSGVEVSATISNFIITA